MDEHLSELRLDEIAAGLAPASAHLDSCERCRGRLDELARGRQSIERDPGYQRVFSRLAAQARTEQASWRRWLLAAPAVAAVAAVAIGVAVFPHAERPETEARIKGAPRIAVVRADGARPAAFNPGEKVFLSAAGAGLEELIVFAEGPHGDLEQLWPVSGDSSRAIGAGAEARLQPAFEVTPGDVVLHALFSSQPLPASEARALIEASLLAPGKSAPAPGRALVTLPLRVGGGER